MSFARTERIAHTLLYEGYVLFPYRADALKNRMQSSFGELVPEGAFGRSHASAEVLLEALPGFQLCARVGLLQPVARVVLDPGGTALTSLEVEGERLVPWHEAREHRVDLGPFAREGCSSRIDLPGFTDATEIVAHGERLGSLVRSAEPATLELSLSLREAASAPHVSVIACSIRNVSPAGAEPAKRSLHSVHLALSVAGGAFVSVIDPPLALKAVAESCEADGLWPFLAGPPGDRSTALLSPIIIYDHPEIAPESPLETFDATENDELLHLAVLSLSRDERAAMRATDARARALLDGIERASPALPGLHGAIRSLRDRPPSGPRVRVGVGMVGVGDRVTIRPNGRDSLDCALEGQPATVVDVLIEAEGREHLVVVLDSDPGRDLGLSGVGLGHRFFVSPREVALMGGASS